MCSINRLEIMEQVEVSMELDFYVELETMLAHSNAN